MAHDVKVDESEADEGKAELEAFLDKHALRDAFEGINLKSFARDDLVDLCTSAAEAAGQSTTRGRVLGVALFNLVWKRSESSGSLMLLRAALSSTFCWLAEGARSEHQVVAVQTALLLCVAAALSSLLPY